ncbi:hypothetical protein [Paenibacillus spongiae]|uniref:Uncharacterized protein n=1 Tax=Paenibacillus spongiae TaxID=2909671 RepID=A0ABY5SE86_9BACL|nr:hypothetical protein [Paenibacillus spongiae]UVI31838.1 hypothetical protein L1F29_08495 [Paenibacillus spongiae]
MKPIDNDDDTGQSAYLFNVDILVEGSANAVALERLLHLLNNNSGVRDFRVNSGIQLGEIIRELEQRNGSNYAAVPIPEHMQGGMTAAVTEAASADASSAVSKPSIAERIRGYIAENRLIRLSVNKGQGVKLNIPCRVIQFDESTQLITVYHVDEKQVYAFNWNEIDDFVV